MNRTLDLYVNLFEYTNRFKAEWKLVISDDWEKQLTPRNTITVIET